MARKSTRSAGSVWCRKSLFLDYGNWRKSLFYVGGVKFGFGHFWSEVGHLLSKVGYFSSEVEIYFLKVVTSDDFWRFLDGFWGKVDGFWPKVGWFWKGDFYFLLKAKCKVVARALGVHEGDIVFHHQDNRSN